MIRGIRMQSPPTKSAPSHWRAYVCPSMPPKNQTRCPVQTKRRYSPHNPSAPILAKPRGTIAFTSASSLSSVCTMQSAASHGSQFCTKFTASSRERPKCRPHPNLEPICRAITTADALCSAGNQHHFSLLHLIHLRLTHQPWTCSHRLLMHV